MDETKEYFGLAASARLGGCAPISQLIAFTVLRERTNSFCALDLDLICHIRFDLIP